jgi:hypothetical protein
MPIAQIHVKSITLDDVIFLSVYVILSLFKMDQYRNL